MRPVSRFVAGAVLAVSAAGSPAAHGAPQFTTKYVYYDVSGATALDIYISMLRHGPHVNGEKAYATTFAKFSPALAKFEMTKSCRIVDYQNTANFTIRLPHLTDASALSPHARQLWRQFYSFVKRHEETHISIWRGCVRELETKVMALRERTCDEVVKKIEIINNQVQKSCTRKQLAFDAAEQKRLAAHPFIKLVLAPIYKSARITGLTARKRKRSAALVNFSPR